MLKKTYIMIFLCFSCSSTLEVKKNNFLSSFESTSLGIGVICLPNESTVRKIAKEILLEIYGNDILNQIPFEVNLLNDDIWEIKGKRKVIELRGNVYMKIRKKDCKLIELTHGK